MVTKVMQMQWHLGELYYIFLINCNITRFKMRWFCFSPTGGERKYLIVHNQLVVSKTSTYEEAAISSSFLSVMLIDQSQNKLIHICFCSS